MFTEVLIHNNYALIKERLTYGIPEGKTLMPGMVVHVPFRTTTVTAIVRTITKEKPAYPTKEISGIVSEKPLLKEWQITLAEWMSKEYDTPLLKIIKLFVPELIWDGTFSATDKPRAQKKMNALALDHAPGKNLTEPQQKVIHEILEGVQKITLLHGVHSSGKTEVYCAAAQKMAEKKRQTCIVVPDLNTIPQLYSYLEPLFSTKIAIFSSQQSKTEIAAAWWRVFTGDAVVAIGTRSALFAPFQNLELVILDEEHDWSYRSDQAPRYHPREIIAEMAKKMPQMRAVFASATPSIESYYQATQSHYNFAVLNERITSFASSKKSLPLHGTTIAADVTIVDLRDELKKGNHSPLSDTLIENIALTLKRKEQTLLIVNRRGFASAVLCRTCGFIERCDKCTRPLVYHIALDRNTQTATLLCHHCGTRKPVPVICGKCKNATMKFIGSGTQQIEAELKKRFPLARILRADQDTLKKKGTSGMFLEKILAEKVDIIIGTSVMSKNLDLPKVTCAGIILADQPLYSPDFRSNEQTFQLISSVCGRAGRRDIRGRVIIQTYNPDHPTIQAAVKGAYTPFAEEELKMRKMLELPPYTELMTMTYSAKDLREAEQEAAMMATLLKSRGATVVVTPAGIPKAGPYYQMDVVVRHKNLEEIMKNVKLTRGWKRVRQ